MESTIDKPTVQEVGRHVGGIWLDQALESYEPREPLSETISADVCIVGGGYTGLWTALRVKELRPGAEVVLIEKNVCGDGASGRNEGQLLDWWAKLSTFEANVGTQNALRLGRLAEEAIGGIGEFCKENAVDAGFRRSGWLWAASNKAQLGVWDPVIRLLTAREVEPPRVVNREEAVHLGGSPRLLGGVLFDRAAVVQPAKLAHGLREAAARRGVRIHEWTPMTTLDRGHPAVIHTPSGTITAERVVLAMNAWLIRFRELARSMFVVGSDIAASESIPERLKEAGLTSGVPVTDSRMLLKYFRTTPHHELLCGLAGSSLVGPLGRGRSVFDGPPTARRVSRLSASLRFLFPSLADLPLTRCWTGPVDRSWNGLPFFGSLRRRPNVFYGAGYSGNGIGPSYLGGRVLASLALERDDEWTEIARLLPPRRELPPQPVAYAGGRLVRAAVARRERLEDADRQPDRITAALARLAPSGVIPQEGVGESRNA